MNREQLPEGWEVTTLGRLCNFVRGPFGGSLTKSCFRMSGYAVYEQQHAIYDQFENIRYFIDETKYLEMKRFELFPGDLIMSCSGTMGKVSIVPDGIQKGIINQALLKLSPKKDIVVEFLKYWMNSPNFQMQLNNLSQGVAIKNIASVKILKEIQILKPSVDEQKRIVAILDEAFEGIDQAIRNTEKNLANARELFESYLNKIFTQKGDGWEEKRLADISEVQSGGTPLRSKSNYWSGEIAWYSSGELNDLYTNKPERTITDEGLVNSNAKLFPKGSLLVGMYDTAALKMSILDREAAFNQAIAGVKPNEKIDLVFILHAINFVKPEILSLRRGVRQKNLSLQKIKDISITIPDLEKQKKVVLQLASIKKETQRLETIYRQKLTALNELKQSILQKAFTGQLTSKNC